MSFCKDVIEEETGKPMSISESSFEENGKNGNDELPAVGQDANGVALRSSYSWTEKAVARILKVPAGFMRDRTQTYVEDIAAEQGVSEIDLPQVKGGLDIGRKKMEEMLGQAKAQAPDNNAGSGAEGCPANEKTNGQEEANATDDVPKNPKMMNEVGLMSEMENLRKN
jgi:hypothetical protein